MYLMAGQKVKCEDVREQLIGQGYSALRKGLMGVGIPLSLPLVEGWSVAHGLCRSQCLYLLIH